MIDYFSLIAQFKEVADLNGFGRGPLYGGPRDIMRKSTLPNLNFGPGYCAYCELKWYGKISKVASLLRDTEDLGVQICVQLNTLRGGKFIRNLFHLEMKKQP